MRILCVDDSGLFRRTLRKQLQGIGYWDCKDREDIAKAANDLESDPLIKLVIADHHIASGTGTALLRWMRAHPDERIRSIPVIIITGDHDRDILVGAAKYGAQAILLKPIALDELERKVNAIVSPAG